MLSNLVNNKIIGYLEIIVEGYYIERFINNCKKLEIKIFKIEKLNESTIKCQCKLIDYKKILINAKKIGCKVKIKNKKGIRFFINRYRKRKIFFICLFVIVFFIYVSSNFVWEIEINIENGEILSHIEEDLEESGLSIGILKEELNVNGIINEVRTKREDIAWMGIEITGTKVMVKIVKATESPEIIDNNIYTNIVSEKSGIITKINVQNGTAAVNQGEIIKAGDVLVNGWMEGNYTGIRYVNSTADITARVWYEKSINIPYIMIKYEETENSKNTYGIKINNFKINFDKKLLNFQFYDTIETENRINIFNSFFLPISIIKTTYTELEKKEYNFDKEEAITLGKSILEEQLNNELKENSEIVNIIVDTIEKENSIDILITYEVIEEIGIKKEIIF